MKDSEKIQLCPTNTEVVSCNLPMCIGNFFAHHFYHGKIQTQNLNISKQNIWSQCQGLYVLPTYRSLTLQICRIFSCPPPKKNTEKK